MEYLKEFFKIQRIQRKRLKIAYRSGFQIDKLHPQQRSGKNVAETVILHEKLDLCDNLPASLDFVKEEDRSARYDWLIAV